MKNLNTRFATFYILVIFSLLLIQAQAKAEVIFDGYYKILLSGQHVGYAIQQNEMDTKKNEFRSKHYIYFRLGSDGKQFHSESLDATSTMDFKPKTAHYTAILQGQPLTVDLRFKGNQMSGTKTQGKNVTPIKATLKDGTFLSSSLLYIILKKGMGVGKGYQYHAVAEEDGTETGGNFGVQSETTYKGHKAFQVEYTFKNIKSKAYVSEKGEVLYTDSPNQSVNTELVTNPNEAKLNFPFPEKTLKTLFGRIPPGKSNALARGPKPSPEPNPQTIQDQSPKGP